MDTDGRVRNLPVAGCQVWDLKAAHDERGALLALEAGPNLPFQPKRVFFVYDVAEGTARGQHAHRVCSQMLLAAAGALTVTVDDGSDRIDVRLDRPEVGLFVPKGTWCVLHAFTPGAVLAVAASHPYDAEDDIKDYDEYLGWVQGG